MVDFEKYFSHLSLVLKHIIAVGVNVFCRDWVSANRSQHSSQKLHYSFAAPPVYNPLLLSLARTGRPWLRKRVLL